MNYDDLQYSFAEVYFGIQEVNIKKDLYGEDNKRKFYTRQTKTIKKTDPFANVKLGGIL